MIGAELLEALPMAVYTTDCEGRITFYNEAAAELWGCRPQIGTDLWCGSWRLYWPDGRPLPAVPPAAAVPDDPAQALRAQHDAQGLHLHARTACPAWLGERLDVGWAIDVLHPLAARGVRTE